jgi:hypothetical protein
MNVRAADTCPYGPQQDFARSGSFGHGNVANLKLMGGLNRYSEHGIIFVD